MQGMNYKQQAAKKHHILCIWKKVKNKKETNLFEYDYDYKLSLLTKLSTIVEEITIDINVTVDKI